MLPEAARKNHWSFDVDHPIVSILAHLDSLLVSRFALDTSHPLQCKPRCLAQHFFSLVGFLAIYLHTVAFSNSGGKHTPFSETPCCCKQIRSNVHSSFFRQTRMASHSWPKFFEAHHPWRLSTNSSVVWKLDHWLDPFQKYVPKEVLARFSSSRCVRSRFFLPNWWIHSFEWPSVILVFRAFFPCRLSVVAPRAEWEHAKQHYGFWNPRPGWPRLDSSQHCIWMQSAGGSSFVEWQYRRRVGKQQDVYHHQAIVLLCGDPRASCSSNGYRAGCRPYSRPRQFRGWCTK